MSSLLDRHGDTLSGIVVAAGMIGFFVWLAPYIGVSYVQIALVVGAFATAFLSGVAGEWLKGRNSKPLIWVGHLFVGVSIALCVSLIAGFILIVIWAKFSAPASDCFRCD